RKGSGHTLHVAREKVIRAINNDDALLSGPGSRHLLQPLGRAIAIVASLQKHLGFRASLQEGEIGIVNRRADADQFLDSRVGAAHAQPHPAPETESGNKDRRTGKSPGQKMNGCADVLLLANSFVVLPGAAPSAAEIEAQYRQNEL